MTHFVRHSFLSFIFIAFFVDVERSLYEFCPEVNCQGNRDFAGSVPILLYPPLKGCNVIEPVCRYCFTVYTSKWPFLEQPCIFYYLFSPDFPPTVIIFFNGEEKGGGWRKNREKGKIPT